MMFILRDYIRDIIYDKVDKFKKDNPHVTESRDEIFQDMLSVYVEYGEIPDIEAKHEVK